jgi:antitoxin component YwqK of YwqJK toxin-antitoxin module
MNNGYNIEYYPNGFIKFEGFINNGKKEGICKIGYYNHIFYNWEKAFYINDIKCGDYEIYSGNFLIEKGIYNNNIKIQK